MHVLDTLDFTASVVVTAFVNGLWQGLLLLGLVWCLLRIFEARRRLNATTRYAVWSVTLAVLAGLPVGAGLIAALPADAPTPPVRVEAARPLPEGAAAPALAESPPAAFGEDASPVLEEAAVADEPPVVLAEPLEETAAAQPALRSSRQRLALPSSMGGWMPFLVGAWLLMALLLAARVAWSYAYLRGLKRQSIALPSRYQERLDAWRRAYGLRRPVRMAASETLTAPVAAGLRRPMILVPLTLLDQLTEEEFEQVALHEWAHLQRWDDWSNLFQRLAEAIFFFHPAVWWAGRQMNREREMACDEWVVWRTRQPRSYAACLARLVELNVQARALLVAPGMAASKERLFERVKRLLDQRRPITAHLSKTGLLTIVLVLGSAFLLMARLAPVFTVQESEPEIVEPAPVSVLEAPKVRVVEPVSVKLAEPVRVSASVVISDTILAYRALQQAQLRLQQNAILLSESSLSLEAASVRLQYGAVPGTQIKPVLRQVGGQREDLSVASWLRLLKSAARIASSGDKARFLVEAAQKLPESEAVYAAFLETTQTVGSSGDKVRVLSALLAYHRLDKAAMLLFLDATRGVASSGDKARLLVEVAPLLPDDEDARRTYLDVADTIPSPGDHRLALSALLNAQR